jgi:hypothetical protein
MRWDMMIFYPVDTEIGIMKGRDAIYLDEIEYNYAKSTVKLIGEINGSLCSKFDGDIFIKYELEFHGVYIYKMIELDLSYELLKIDYGISSFIQVVNSDLVKHAKDIRGVDLKHFVIQTYDDVFEIVCNEYKLSLNLKNKKH